MKSAITISQVALFTLIMVGHSTPHILIKVMNSASTLSAPWIYRLSFLSVLFIGKILYIIPPPRKFHSSPVFSYAHIFIGDNLIVGLRLRQPKRHIMNYNTFVGQNLFHLAPCSYHQSNMPCTCRVYILNSCVVSDNLLDHPESIPDLIREFRESVVDEILTHH